MATAFTDDDLLAALRDAAGGSALSTAAYERHRETAGGPSVAWIIRRFGSWRAACTAAGLPTHARSARAATWTDEQLVAHVAAYLADLEPGVRGSFAGYSAWATAQQGAPSGATVRARMPWADARRRAAGEPSGS
ncbi:homing endonuclease associated repeat-containing protein [Nocardioides sambongensis]|uniref:homing endonuclease associated repeat-containing protein n=1 Tax=Nocardioides sambongensis TaxID=2589074 RepID=UPI0011289F84|nr:hypothetical protein [Nocardioides sambongensis]